METYQMEGQIGSWCPTKGGDAAERFDKIFKNMLER